MRRKGPWPPEQIDLFLEEIRAPIRLACNAASGHPAIAIEPQTLVSCDYRERMGDAA